MKTYLKQIFKYSKKTLIIIISFIFTNALFSQASSISGTIKDEDGNALVGAIVTLLPSNLNTNTDERGAFNFNNLNYNTYNLTVKYLDFEEVNEKVEINSDQPYILSINLNTIKKELKEVTITANKKHNPTELNKMDVDLKDMPVTIHSVDLKVIEQRGAIDLGDAMKNVTGVRTRNTYGGFQHFQIRGMEQFVLLIDGVRDERHNIKQSAPTTNLAAVEGIDVLKGPSSVMFGHSALGGIINIRRKQPTDNFKGNFSATYGSFDTKNMSVGAGGPISEKLSFRADLGTGQSVGFRGLGSKYTNGYFSLKYKPAKKHTLQFNIQGNDDFYSTDTGIPVLADGTLVKGMDPKTRYNDPQDFLKNKRIDLQLKYVYKINDKFSISNLASYYIDDINYFSTEELTINATKDSLKRSFPFYFNHQTKPFQNQLEFNGAYNIGNLKNKFVIGHSLSILDRKTYRGNITGPGKNTTISITNPVLNQGAIFITDNRYQAKMETVNGVFLQNWFDISKKWKALAAIRVDMFSGEYYTDQTDANRNVSVDGEKSNLNITNPTYRLGLVYKPIESISTYASYSTYFKPTRTVAADGSMFDPEQGFQAEVGFRYEHKSLLSINVAGFSLARTNILQSLPGGQFKNIGTGTSKGAELDINGNITNEFSVKLGYTYAFTNIENNSDDAFVNVNAGKRLSFAPEHLFNSWLVYEFSKGKLNGFGFGAGVNYTSDNFTDPTNTYKLPAYYTLESAMWYKFNRFEIRVNGNNLTNTFYYRDAIFDNQFFMGATRNFSATFSAKF